MTPAPAKRGPSAAGEDAGGRPTEEQLPTHMARRLYRRRRLMDAARLMPAFGTVLFLLPVLWILGERQVSTARGMIYMFVAWLALIGLAGLLARRLSDPIRARDPQAESQAGPDHVV